MHALAQLCVRRPVFATMLVLSLVVVGIFCYFSLGVDLFPKVDIPTVAVVIANPGASPEEIETEITRKVEDAVNTISQIDEVRSTSSEGQSLVLIQFELSKNGDVAAQEVQNKVNIIIPNLPETAKQPVVQKFDPDAAPIMQIAVSAPRSLRDVTLIADKLIKQKLENTRGVGQITIVGGANREIHVMVDPDRLRAYRLTVNDVFNALRSQNLELPGGNLKEGARELTVRTTGRVADAAQFNQITVANRNGYIVKVADIGYAEDSYEEPRTAARLDGKPSVTLVVAKQSGVNTVDTADEVRLRLAQISSTLPRDVTTQVVADQSVFIKAAVENIRKHLIEGSIFAAIIIFLFLANIRTTLIAAVAIPTSIISTFALMAAMGFTLNQITMLALTLMVGIVIDDAIIVLENVFRFIEEKNMPPFEAAIQGTKEIGLAVMATTLSLLAVFLPVGFMGGIVGRFMSSFGFTSAFAIAVSLLVSFTLTPMLCSRFIKRPDPAAPGQHSSKDAFIFKHLDAYYTRMLVWSMNHRKAVVAGCVVVVLSIVPLFMFVGKNFLPKDDQAQYNVLIRTPEGTSLAASTQIGEQIASEIRRMPGVAHTLLTVGSSADKSVNNGSIFVKLTDIDQRDISQSDLMDHTRVLMKNFPPDIHTSVELVSSVGGNQSNADIQYFIQGPDLQKLAEYSDKLQAKMRAMPGLVDVDSTLRSGKPEVRLEIDRPRAADLGVSVLDIEQALNTLVAGQTASTFNAGEDQYDVVVRAQEKFRGGIEGLSKLTVPSTRVGLVGLDEVVRIKPGTGPSSINRINRQRQVTLTGNVLPGGSQAAILKLMDEAAADLNMGPDYHSGLTGTSKELGRTGFYFALAFGLTFIFMYIVLAAQFESFIHPVTILLTLPLAVPFGILSLLIAGQTVNIFSGLGLLLLFGIVKKNAILQIDHTNGLRGAGMPRYEAIIQANRDRLRPILMTTIALVAGMAPLVISRGVGSATNRSIGVLVVGGQTLCLLLTLLAVPVFYSLWEDFAEFFARVRSRVFKTAAVTTAFIGSLFAQPAIPPVQKVAAPPRPGILTQAPLRLNEVIERVLKNDPDLAVARINVEESAYSITGAQGAWDPLFGIRSYRTRAVTPIASLIGGSANGKLTNTELNFTPTMSGNTPWGGTYSLNFANSRQQTDSTFVTLNPQYPTSLTLALVQPLWRGLRYDDNRHRLEVARKNRQLTGAQFRQRVTDVVTQAIQAYWELDYAYHNVGVQTEAVQLAERQYDSNKRQAEQGILAPVDVVAAQTQVATFQQSLLAAQQMLTQAENNLKMLMLADRGDLMWSAALIPETPLDSNVPLPGFDDAVKQALAARPEIAEAALALDINRADQRLARETSRPRVDAFANLISAGLAGAVIPFNSPFLSLFPGAIGQISPILSGSYGQSISNVFNTNFPTAQVGVTVSLPIRNRAALAQAAIAAAEGRRLKFTQNQVEMAVEADVRNSLQAVESSRARLEAAGIARRSADEQYSSEQRQFQAGTSSVFLVLQRQTDLISARNREVRARADLAEALAALDRATARTIEARGIAVK
ncbi:MAG: efflux RND transporter permease subunit [Acidobacteria bacterium]|nr:efflux RND transporter permease subunit [Acidobacteriota bacterium]